MAAEILRAWGAFPLKIEISDKQADMRSSIGGSSKAQLTFEAPLPWPAPLPSETVRRARPEVTDLGLISLKIRGIPSGKYMISVDGSAGVEYTADQIKEGIPVSSEKARQASRFVADLVRKRADLFFMRWRQIEVPLTKDYKHATSAISSIDAVVEEMTVRARALSKPYKYEVTITPVQ
jgi:hypothetical protein